MKKKKIVAGSLLVLSLFLIGGCGKKIPVMANGEEAVVTLKDKDFSVTDLYTEMKDSFALQSLITMTDTYIFETEFADYKEEAASYAKSYMEALINNYGGEDKFLSELKQYTNYSTTEAYEHYIYLSYLQSHAAEEYAKLQITDKQISKYYKNTSVGDIEVSHILITVDTASDATSDEKTKAQDTAKGTINEIITKLNDAKNNGEDIATKFSELAKEYSKDDATKDSGGSLGKINYGTLASTYDELVKAAYSLKDGEYSTSVITTELGYHVILRTKTYEKDTLENLSDSIRKTLAEELVSSDSTISVKALQYYRKLYNLEIQDSELKSQYSIYMQNLLASATSSTDSNS